MFATPLSCYTLTLVIGDPTTEAPITEATNYAAQVIEAAEAVEAIKAQTKPRV